MRDAYVVSGVTGLPGLTGADTAYSIGGGTSPSDSNTGLSRLSPYLSIQKGLDVVEAAGGGTVYVEGRFYLPDATVYYASKTDSSNVITIKANPAGERAYLKLSNKIGTAGWTAVGGGVYTITCDAGGGAGHTPNGGANLVGKVANIAGWVYDYDWTGNQDAASTAAPLVVHKSFIPISASAVAAAAAAGSAQGGVFLDNTTGLVTLGLPAGQAAPSGPNACGLEYVYKGRSGIGALTSSAANTVPWTIDGLAIGPIVDGTTGAPAGCGVATQGKGVTVQNCDMFDPGVHGVSCGSGVKDIRLNNNRYHGGASGSSYEVFNPGTTTTATNCRSNGALFGGWTPVGCDGNFIAAGTNIGGALTHGDAGACLDCEWVNPQFLGYIPPSGVPCLHIDYLLADGPASSTYEGCGTRVRQTNPNIWTTKNGTGMPSQGNTTQYQAMINCRIDNSAMNRLGSFAIMVASNAAGQVWNMYLDGCEVIGNLANPDGSDFSAFYFLGTGSTLRYRNTSFYDVASSHSNHGYGLVYYAGTPDGVTGLGVIGSQGIVGYRDVSTGTFQVIRGDTGISTTFIQFTNNQYFNIGATTWADDGARNAAAEWASTIDTGQVNNGTTNPFADATGATGLGLKTTEKTRKKLVTNHTARGSNQLPYAANYGSNQYGASQGVRRPSRVGGSRRGTGPR